MRVPLTEQLVSIVIPAYNCAAYLGEALADVLGQTHRKLQVIVVDDGSTDATLQVATDTARTDERLHVVHTDNHGPSHARNVGLLRADGTWVWCVDADDRVRPDAVELLLASATQHGADLAVANVVPFDESGTLPRTHCLPEPFPPEAPTDGIELLRQVFRGALGGFSYQFFMSRDVLRSLERQGALFPEDIRIFEDVVFAIGLAGAVHQVSYVSKPLYLYRQRPSSAAHDLGPATVRCGLEATRRIGSCAIPPELARLRTECVCRLYLYLYGSAERGPEMDDLRRAIRARVLDLTRDGTEGLSPTVRTKVALLRAHVLTPALGLARAVRAWHR